ncbi:MAG: CHASE2 domain-containing protein [Chthoniobacterales bacterium]
MFRGRIVAVIILTAICSAAAIYIDWKRPTDYVLVEDRIRDVIARSGRTTPANPDLVFLAIDSDSVTLDEDLDVKRLFSSGANDLKCHRALEIMSKGWPWNREIYGLILERLVSAGVKVVAYDCLFPAPAPGDNAFRAVVDQFKSQVVIGGNFVSPTDIDRSRRIPSTYDPPAGTIISRGAIPDDRIGFTNFFTDEDKVVRGTQLRAIFRQPGHPPAVYLSLSARAVSKAGHPETVPNDLAERLIRFTGPPRLGFPSRPVFEIFVPEYWEHNYGSGEFFRNKIVVVGAEGKWQKDELATPFGPMPGAEVHLNVLNALLHDEFLKEPSPLASAAVIALAALLGAALCLSFRSPWLRLLALVGVNGAGPLCALWFYNHPGLYLPCLAPLLALNTNVLFCLVSDFTFELVEEAKLRSTLKSRDDLTHMIVHDLRSPLTAVTGYMDVLAETAKLSSTEAKFVAEAQRGARDLRDMISTLLDVGRLEAGEMPLRLETHDVIEIARKAASRFSPVLKNRTLHCDVPADPVWMTCDAEVIRRILENLISNAVKFTASDGKIDVTVKRNAADVMISVNDNGHGIPPDEHRKIFEKFGQTESGQEHRHSTGLGLTFCRLAVEAHRGKIGVQSEPEKGSTFWFALPISDPSNPNNRSNHHQSLVEKS